MQTVTFFLHLLKKLFSICFLDSHICTIYCNKLLGWVFKTGIREMPPFQLAFKVIFQATYVTYFYFILNGHFRLLYREKFTSKISKTDFKTRLSTMFVCFAQKTWNASTKIESNCEKWICSKKSIAGKFLNHILWGIGLFMWNLKAIFNSYFYSAIPFHSRKF